MRFKFLILIVCLCSISIITEVGSSEPAPSSMAKELLKPGVFPDAQLGMAIVSAEDGPTATVTTTGGVFIIDKSKDTIECRQRQFKIQTAIWMSPSDKIEYGDERSIALVKLARGSLTGIKLTSKTPGAAIFTVNNTTIRINGDSLLMVQPGKSKEIMAELSFVPDYFISKKGDYNFFDRYGGVSFFEHSNSPKSTLQVKTDPITVTWPWKSGDVFWVSVSPPKPYDWNGSIKNRTFIQESTEDRYVYPYDSSLNDMQRYTGTNAVYLYSNRLWEVQGGKIQSRDAAELQRVVKSAHEFGLKVVLSMDLISLENVNSPYLKQIGSLMKQYGIDGISIDDTEQLPQSLANRYYMARTLRNIVGDTGLLYLHDVAVVPKGDEQILSYPTVDSQFNLIWKDENYWVNTN